ncbi:MAG: hypothetical protein V3T22_10620 [Planctomycetota bacterium]
MKKAAAETLARVAMSDGRKVSAPDLTREDLNSLEAGRALHRVWLKGGVDRKYANGYYHYQKKAKA